MINLINCLSISSNSLILALIALILVLIILVVILIIKSNKGVQTSNFLDTTSKKSITDINIDNSELMEEFTPKLATKVEVIKEQANRSKFDLDGVTKQMKKDMDNDNIDLTEFEIEQEEKSIISYKELLAKVNKDKMMNITKNNNVEITKIETGNNNIDEKFDNKNINQDYTFSTEVIDFESELKDEIIKQQKLKEQQEKNTILNIEDSSLSHESFLKSLKTLKDNLG